MTSRPRFIRRTAIWFLLAAAAFFSGCVRPKTALVPAAPSTAHDADLQSDHHEDNPDEAAEFFRQQRVLNDDLLPAQGYLEARRRARSMRRFTIQQGRFVDSRTAGPADAGIHAAASTFGTWQLLGPGNIGGRTRGLVIHPQNRNILWAGGATGGLWKTTDGGQSWAPLSDFLPTLVLNSLAIDPRNPDILYAGTGEQTQNWRGAGVFKTTDGGATWNQLSATATADFYFVNRVAVSTVSGVVYAATNTGLWTSANGGATWSLSLGAPDGGASTTSRGGTNAGCFDVALQPGQSNDVALAVCHPPAAVTYAVYLNPDAAGQGGWGQVLTDPLMWYTVVAFAPSQPNTVYALSVTNDKTGPYSKALLAVYRSQSGGAAGTWVTRTSNQDSNRLNSAILSVDGYYSFPNPFCTADPSKLALGGQDGYNLAAAVDPLDPNRLWALGVGIFRSDDGGANWGWAAGTSNSGTHPDQHLMVFDPAYDGVFNQVAYATTDGGVYKTTSARGVTATCAAPLTSVFWTGLNNSYATTQFYHGVPYPGGGAYLGGTQDNNTVRGTDAGGPNEWYPIYGGDGGVSRVDPVNVSNVYVEYVHGSFARSTDGGDTFTNAVTGITEASTNFVFIAPYVFDPNNSLRLYTGGAQLWRTEDGMADWTAASAAIPTISGAVDSVTAIAVSAVNPNLVVFGSHYGKIFRSASALYSDATTVWPSSQPRVGTVSHLEFDPSNANTIYATYSTFNSLPTDQHVYRSMDAGTTWTGIDGSGSSGLPDIPVETILVDPDDSTRLYLGTDLGVFASFDGGNTWARDSNPFADVITSHLTMDRTAGRKDLYAFTYGRGVWRVALGAGGANTCSYSVSPTSVTLDAAGDPVAVAVNTAANCPWSVYLAPGSASASAYAQGPASGVGSGTVYIAAAANRNTATRTTTLMVQGQALTVRQPGPASGTAPPSGVILQVTPRTVVVSPGGTQQFTATMTSPLNTAVRWSISPQIGVISPTGLYTAPALYTPGAVTVTAQSLAISGLLNVANVTIQAPAASLAAPSVTSAASFQSGAVAPGEVVTLFGGGMGPVTAVGAQLDALGNLASSLAGTQVVFDGIAAPLVYVSSKQVSAIVPYEVAKQKTTQMLVLAGGQASAPVTLNVALAVPALFTADTSGSGQAAALNQDNSYNSAKNPAAAGSVVTLFATGEGQTSPAGTDGLIANSTYPAPVAPVTVTIGGVAAEVLYAGAAPQETAGVLQVNVRIPAGVAHGANAVVLTVGGISGRAGVTVAVQ